MSDAKPNPAELDRRARELHAWFCRETGANTQLRMTTLTMWIDWMLAGHNGKELARVIRYLRVQIGKGKRNDGAMALENLLVVATFEKDLALADMARSGGFDPERRVSAPPDAENAPTARPARLAAPPKPGPKQPTPEQIAEREAEFARLRKEML